MRYFALFLTVLLVATFGCGKSGNRSPGLDYLGMRGEVVKQVKEGSIVPDASGKAILSETLKSVCKSGFVYVASNAPEGLSIVFVESLKSDGQASSDSGLLYSENEIVGNGKRVRVGPVDWSVVGPPDPHYRTVTGGH
jgi:hypothetical protein